MYIRKCTYIHTFINTYTYIESTKQVTFHIANRSTRQPTLNWSEGSETPHTYTHIHTNMHIYNTHYLPRSKLVHKTINSKVKRRLPQEKLHFTRIRTRLRPYYCRHSAIYRVVCRAHRCRSSERVRWIYNGVISGTLLIVLFFIFYFFFGRVLMCESVF